MRLKITWDFSASKIDGSLDLNYQIRILDLVARDAMIDTLHFGTSSKLEFSRLDLRGARVLRAEGTFPANVRELYLDDKTEIPAGLARHIGLLKK